MRTISRLLVWLMALALFLPATSALAQDGPTLTIISPQAGEMVNPTMVQVSGTGATLPDNNITIQALDDAGNLLNQVVTTLEAEAGGAGSWSASLPLRIAPGATGQIVALAVDPATGAQVAQSAVNVTFGQGAAPEPTDEPIVEPEPPIAILPTDPPTEEPTAEPTAEPTDAPVVEPTQEPTQEPTEEPTVEPTQVPTQEPTEEPTVEPTEEPTAEPTQEPTEEPTEEPTAEPTEEPTVMPPSVVDITIASPRNGAVIGSTAVDVAGTGVALPENNVVVQVLDGTGTVLAQEATTADAPLGGAGPWSVTLTYAAAPGESGRITAFAPSPADAVTVARDEIEIQFAATPVTPANITIEIPQAGEEVSPQEVVVVGTGVSLPENNVVVQALDSRGNVLAEQAATVAADLGAEGEWRVTLRPDAQPGTSGRIYAFASSPEDGSILAEAAIDVRYGRANAQPSIAINSPAAGARVNTDSGFGVSGTGANLVEGNVVIEVRDANGRRIAQRPTTVDGNGFWSVNLYTGAIDGAGSIIAYSPSPADNSRLAEDRIDVTFVSSPTAPITPNIVIERPQNGGVVNTTSGFVVSGRAQALFENNVIVQARDAFGNLLTQVVTTADQNGNWSATLRFLTANGDRGSIYAFSTSPVDGSITTDDLVRVTFAGNCQVRTEWPVYVVQPGDTLFSIAQRTGSTVGELTVANCLANPNRIERGQRLFVPRLPDSGIEIVTPEMTIISPVADAELALDAPLTVDGSALGVLTGNVFVRALDADGRVLDSVRGSVVAEPDGDGVWRWQAELRLRDVTSGTHGALFAYAVSPLDGRIETSALVPVIYGAAADGPYLTIAEPAPYSQVAEAGVVTVSGRGAALFENNVVVRALDNDGNVLMQTPTTMAAEVGGAGEWSVDLAVDYVGRGRIEAFSDSPADGSIMASAGVDVFFGDPLEAPSAVVITHPLPNEVYTFNDRLVTTAGFANGVFDDQVFVTVVGARGNILFVIPVEVNPETGFWATSLDVQFPVDRDEQYVVNVLGANPGSGAVMTGDRIAVESRAPEAAVTGTVNYLVRMALPDDAVVTVQLADISRAGAPADVIGEQVITNAGQVPIPFVVEYDPSVIDERFTYAVTATITDGEGSLLFRNTTIQPVITRGAPTTDVEVIVDPIQ